MAFPAVQTRSTGTANAGALVCTLPASSTTGDLIVIMMQANSTTTTWTPTSGTTGWTELTDNNGQAIRYKELGADLSNPSFDLSTSERSGFSALRITGAEDPATQAPESNAEATATSTGPNPAANTPTGGAKDYLWIAICGMGDGRATVDAIPSSYANSNAFASPGAGGGVAGGTAERQLNAASENANAFTIGRNVFWSARSVAVHPPAAAGAIGVHLTQSFFLTGNLRKLVG